MTTARAPLGCCLLAFAAVACRGKSGDRLATAPATTPTRPPATAAPRLPSPEPEAPPPSAAGQPAPGAADPTAVPGQPSVADEILEVEETENNPRSEKVTVRISVSPGGSRVYWGRKNLGRPPVELVRDRGSGPLDLVIRAPGYLPMHTRAFADRDDKLFVRLFTEREAPRLLGYRRTDGLSSPVPAAAPPASPPPAPAPGSPPPIPGTAEGGNPWP